MKRLQGEGMICNDEKLKAREKGTFQLWGILRPKAQQ